MVLGILLRRIDLGSFLMVAARIFIFVIFVPADTSSTMVIRTFRFPAMVDQPIRLLFGFFFPDILVLVFLPMVIDYFNDCACAPRLGIASRIKIMGEPSLIFLFLGLWFDIYLRLSPEKYKIVSSKKKEFEDIVSFRHYFIVVETSLCLITMYYYLLI
jgi:hypothetical protein